MTELFWMTGKAFLIALILTPIFRDIFRSYNLVDRPAQRKVHAYPIPRVGGIPIAIAYAVALISVSGSDTWWGTHGMAALKLIPGAALVFLIGLIDDFFTLRPRQKLFGLTVAAGVAFFSGVRIDVVLGFTLNVWLAFSLTVFWLLLTTNALNLIDGLDGLCAGMGLFATLTLFAASVLMRNHALSFATLPLAGALLGFLCYNMNPATVFLGDSGALLVGFLLGCYGIIWTQKVSTLVSMMVPLLALSIPLLDVSLSILRRFLRNQPIFSADRRHIHHRLLDRGLSARQAVWVLYLVATLAAGFALLVTTSSSGKYTGVVVAVFIAAVLFGISQLRYSEFDIASRALFRGEFYRVVEVKVQLAQMEAALAASSSEEMWWKALTEGALRHGLVSVEWSGPACRRCESLRASDGDTWTFELPLGNGDTIRLRGPVATGLASFDLIGLAGAVERTFPRNRVRILHPVAERAVVATP